MDYYSLLMPALVNFSGKLFWVFAILSVFLFDWMIWVHGCSLFLFDLNGYVLVANLISACS